MLPREVCNLKVLAGSACAAVHAGVLKLVSHLTSHLGETRD